MAEATASFDGHCREILARLHMLRLKYMLYLKNTPEGRRCQNLSNHSKTDPPAADDS